MKAPPFPVGCLTAARFEHAPIPHSPKRLDIPRYDEHITGRGRPYVFYTYAKQRQRQLNLDEPEFSADDVLLRVYLTFSGDGVYQRGALLEFRKNGETWQGRGWRYEVFYNQWSHREELSRIQPQELAPRKGWADFEAVFASVDFERLPTEWALEHLMEWLERTRPPLNGPTLTIEYATPALYRLMVFTAPNVTRDGAEEARRLDAFMIYVDDEFERRESRAPAAP